MAGLNGGGGEWLGTHPYPHDFVQFNPRGKASIFKKCARLYESGLSLREIEAKTGVPKTSVREALIGNGLALRGTGKGQSLSKREPASRRPPVCPYGYDWLEGRLVVVPAEYRVVIRILELWKAGKSQHSISEVFST